MYLIFIVDQYYFGKDKGNARFGCIQPRATLHHHPDGHPLRILSQISKDVVCGLKDYKCIRHAPNNGFGIVTAGRDVILENPNSYVKVLPVSDSYTVSAGTAAPANSALTELAFGAYGASGTQVTADSLTFANGSISFSGGAGVFQGNASGSWAPSPTNQNTVSGVTNDYLSAIGGSSLNINFTSTQKYFGLLWGSMNDGNELQFYKNGQLVYTLTADDILTDNPDTASSEGNYYVSINIPDGYDQVVASSSSGGFEFANVTYAATTVSAPFDGTGVQTTIPYDPSDNTYLCFLEGTMIATPDGEQPVETLRPGALVLTAGGQAEPVRWIGTRAVSTRFADPFRAYPVRISAGALADGVPSRDLFLSPDHALLIDGILINAAALADGDTVRREAVMPELFTYYHIELAAHGLVLAENTPAETFVDNASRAHFDNWATHPDHGAVLEMDIPRAKSARQVPAQTRARLARHHRKIA